MQTGSISKFDKKDEAMITDKEPYTKIISLQVQTNIMIKEQVLKSQQLQRF